MLLATAIMFLQFATGTSTFNGGPIPSPPPTSVYTYNNIQNAAGPGTWALSTGTQACTPSCPGTYGGTNSQTFGVSSPSLSGSAMQLTSTTSGANYAYNTLMYRQWHCYAPQSGSTTTGTSTINVSGTSITFAPNATNDTITISANATDTTYTVTAIQIYVDGSGTPSFNSSATGPITPIVATLGGFSDAVQHTFAVKAFNSNGGSSIYSFTVAFGPQCGLPTNLINDLQDNPSSTNSVYANEFDPKIVHGGYGYEGAMQCRLVGTAPVNEWYFWNPAGSNWQLWQTTGGSVLGHFPCSLTGNVFNHVTFYVTIDYVAHTVTYVSMTLNGSTVYRNLNYTLNAATYSGELFVFQAQADQIPSSTGPVTANSIFDNWKGIIW
jgi:hypothetical protein